MENRSEKNQFWCQKNHFWLFHRTYAQGTDTNPVRVKNHLHFIILINSFTQTPRSKKYKLESETSHTLCTVSLSINFLSNALQKDGQLKHHTFKMRCFHWPTETLLVGLDDAREMQRQLWTRIYAIIQIQRLEIRFRNSGGLQCWCLHLNLLPDLWSLSSQRIETDTFNCLFLEDMNNFLERNSFSCNGYKACQMEMFSRIRWTPPFRQLVVSHNRH